MIHRMLVFPAMLLVLAVCGCCCLAESFVDLLMFMPVLLLAGFLLVGRYPGEGLIEKIVEILEGPSPGRSPSKRVMAPLSLRSESLVSLAAGAPRAPPARFV